MTVLARFSRDVIMALDSRASWAEWPATVALRGCHVYVEISRGAFASVSTAVICFMNCGK